MNIKLFALACGISIGGICLSSCHKCVTCIPHFKITNNNGQKDSVDLQYEQYVYTCSKTDINAYENGTNYIDSERDTVYFVCK
jgi:hypothetical protein